MQVHAQKLHLGCFDQAFEGWLNTDVTPHIFIQRVPGLSFLLFKLRMLSPERYAQHRRGMFKSVRYLDVTRRFPYAAETFSYAYCSHMLEHLHYQEAVFCTREVYRVLKTGGVFRVAVPDLDALVAGYDPTCPEQFVESMFETRQRHDKNRHWWLYNAVSLARLCREAGFSQVQRCQFGEGRCADVKLIDNRPGSLFMEAAK